LTVVGIATAADSPGDFDLGDEQIKASFAERDGEAEAWPPS
jgi:hypothetical protein